MVTITHYVVALAFTTLLLVTLLINIPDKGINFGVHIGLCMAVSFMWAIIGVNDGLAYFLDKPLPFFANVFLSFTVGCVLWFILLVLTWRESIKQPEAKKGVEYTIETLIGTTGRIISAYGNDDYLGILDDADDSQIFVHINTDKKLESDTNFVITDVKGDKIYADVVE